MDRLISEQQVLKVLDNLKANFTCYDSVTLDEVASHVKGIPPAESNTEHWKAKSFHELFCDNCGFDFDIMRNDFIDKMNYCPNCGARMVEPQESEGKR